MWEWIEQHVGILSACSAACSAIIAWLIRLERRLNKMNSDIQMAVAVIDTKNKRLEKFEQALDAIWEKISHTAEAISRIEGYCSAKDGRPFQSEHK